MSIIIICWYNNIFEIWNGTVVKVVGCDMEYYSKHVSSKIIFPSSAFFFVVYRVFPILMDCVDYGILMGKNLLFGGIGKLLLLLL